MADSAITPEDVLKRNTRERMKKEKAPLDILNELPRLIDQGYETISEDDIVRLQWYGLYHDKPKMGGFMMRIKIPNGILTPQKLRTLGEIAERYGQGYGEITTRQDIQLHSIRLEHLPDIFKTLKQAGLNTINGCGDVVRNITGCPVAGIDREELFDVRSVIIELARLLDGNPAYSDLPRKHKITVAACPSQCNLPEIHCQAYIGLFHPTDGRKGFALRVGGGLSTVPRISKSLGVFIPIEEVLPVTRAILDCWKEDLTYRRSFIKARFKFMVDDLGPEVLRQRIEEQLDRKLEDLTEHPAPTHETTHLGITKQIQRGLYTIGFSVLSGRMDGKQMMMIADLLEAQGRKASDIRLTRQQNLLLTHIPKANLYPMIKQMETNEIFMDRRLYGTTVACTGQPFCNFAVTETKVRLVEIIHHLEHAFGQSIDDLHLYLDGCPHACGHHWIGDIGLMGTTIRTEQGGKLEAYDIILGGGRGTHAAIGRPIGRRIPATEVKYALERLIHAFRNQKKTSNISFQQFCIAHTDEEINNIMKSS